MRFFLSILMIAIICFFGYSFIYESHTKEFVEKYQLFKHSINFIWLGMVFLIGYWGLSKRQPKWGRIFWVIIYLALMSFLFVLGFVDFFVYKFNDNVRDSISFFRFFFQSPLPFFIIWVLTIIFRNHNNNINPNK